ncbi:MFS transporter [Frigoribacterium sp. Leaf186]|uniref:MFS transporter n=1 Tax=Frigoribacterium sp. Leaf186 TaxID=1736293 RepID=UPI0012F8A878|nr:MFS transporter [Frigoribacterium sp. Leaf186]
MTGGPKRGHALSDRAFRRYLAGFGASLVGDQIWFVSLAWAASQLESSGQTALVLAAGSIPRAVLLLVGGAAADRFGALTVALRSQIGRILLMGAGAGFVLALGVDELWPLLVVAVLFGVLDAAHMPAAAALPPQLLAPGDLPAGQGFVQTLERGALVAGAPLGGLVVAFGGLPTAMVVNVVLFLLAWLMLRSLRRVTDGPTSLSERTGDESIRASLTGGLRYAAMDRALLSTLIVVTVLNLGLAGPLNVGLVLLSDERGWGAATYSLVLSAYALGAISGALTVAFQKRVQRPALNALLWIMLGGSALGLVPFAPTFPLAALAVALAGFAFGPGSALLVGLIQARTDRHYLGRVMALVNFSALGLTPIAYVLFGQGVAVSTLEVTFTVSAALVVLAAAMALFVGPLRRARLTTD